jgi:addiction module HigA family antidote
MTLKSSTTTETGIDRLAPVHPGEVLSQEFLEPLGLSANALARRIGVPGNRVSMIVAGKRGVTGDTALRLAAAFGTTPEFWMNLQKGYELAVAWDGVAAEELEGMRV